MVLVTLVKRSFHTLSRRFIGLNNSRTRSATSFPVRYSLGLARHCCCHRNFQLSTRILHDILDFFIIWINEVNTTQFSCIDELRFLDSPLLFFFAFRLVRQVFPHLWPQSVWSGCRLFTCQCLSRPWKSIRWFFILWRSSYSSRETQLLSGSARGFSPRHQGRGRWKAGGSAGSLREEEKES